jgi:hypothetical protein
MRRFCDRVAIVDRADRPIPNEDADVSEAVCQIGAFPSGPVRLRKPIVSEGDPS